MAPADSNARQLAHRLRAEALFGVDIVPLPQALPPVEDATRRDAPTPHPHQARAGRSAAPGPQAHPAPPRPQAQPPRPRPAQSHTHQTNSPPASAAAPLFPIATEDDLASQSLSADDKQKLLEELNQSQVVDCTQCGLCQHRTQTVFGEGHPDARLMFIGEGPGQTEDQTGRPFVGRAGELLDKQIEAMGLKRDDVYIANVVKCRPPNNRTPTPDEVATCGPYLVRQVRIVRPEVIVTLGGPASKLILNTPEGITRLRGRWGQFAATSPPIPVMPTFHPAFLLRAYTRDNRMKVWADLKAAMEKLGIEPPKRG